MSVVGADGRPFDHEYSLRTYFSRWLSFDRYGPSVPFTGQLLSKLFGLLCCLWCPLRITKLFSERHTVGYPRFEGQHAGRIEYISSGRWCLLSLMGTSAVSSIRTFLYGHNEAKKKEVNEKKTINRNNSDGPTWLLSWRSPVSRRREVSNTDAKEWKANQICLPALDGLTQKKNTNLKKLWFTDRKKGRRKKTGRKIQSLSRKKWYPHPQRVF